MEKQIRYALRRVPRLGQGYRYVPLYNLPDGTILELETTNEKTPGELEDHEVNGYEEYDVLMLPEGLYRLQMSLGCAGTLTYENGESEAVSPLTRCLAPSGCLSINLDRPNDNGKSDNWATTWRIFTGLITQITLPQAGIRLHVNDIEKRQPNPKKKRRPRQSYNRKSTRRKPLREIWK